MTTSHTAEMILLGLQTFHVIFLAIHDWIPIAPLNDTAAVRAVDGSRRLLITTLIQTLPFAFGLYLSLIYLGRAWPHSLHLWLWVSYSILFLGELRAWWLPYLVQPEPERAARYRILFGKTHAFLPERNGIVPNTMHVLLHLATAATLLTLLLAHL